MLRGEGRLRGAEATPSRGASAIEESGFIIPAGGVHYTCRKGSLYMQEGWEGERERGAGKYLHTTTVIICDSYAVHVGSSLGRENIYNE